MNRFQSKDSYQEQIRELHDDKGAILWEDLIVSDMYVPNAHVKQCEATTDGTARRNR